MILVVIVKIDSTIVINISYVNKVFKVKFLREILLNLNNKTGN